MATFRTTGSSILSTVATTADAASKLIGTITTGVDMVSEWAERERFAQKEKGKYANHITTIREREQAIQTISDLKLDSAKYAAKSQAHAASYTAAEAIIDQLLSNQE